MSSQVKQSSIGSLLKILVRHKKTYWAISKVLLALALFYTLYSQVVDQENHSEIYDSFIQQLNWTKAPLILFVLVLMFANWAMEAKKWKYLLKDKAPSLSKCFEGIWMGQSFGIMTPGNLGDYGGRQLVLPKTELNRGLTATLVASLAQNVVNIVFGFLGMLFLLKIKAPVSSWVFIAISLLVFVMIILIFFVYRGLPKISYFQSWIKKKSWNTQFIQQTRRLKDYTGNDLNTVLMYSFFRYLIYCAQYILVLNFFGIALSIWVLLAGVAFIFLVQTGLPLPPVLGVLARGEVALFLWTSFGAATIPILAATFSLWLINKVIPAVIGMFLMMKVKID